MVDGWVRIHKISWDAYNESTSLKDAVQAYKERTGYYPKRLLVDEINRNRENLKFCKQHNIQITGKPLGRPKKDETVDKSEISLIKHRGRKNWRSEKQIWIGLLSARLQATSETEIYMSMITMNLARKIRVKFLSFMRLIFKKGLFQSYPYLNFFNHDRKKPISHR